MKIRNQMKRFVWRLQRVLEIKTKEEQKKRAELLELTEELARFRRELLTQQKILEDIISDIAGQNPQKRLGEQEFFLKCSVTNDELIKKLRNKVSNAFWFRNTGGQFCRVRLEVNGYTKI